MRVLALADKPFHADVAKLAANYDVDAILTLGDLQPSWLEPLEQACTSPSRACTATTTTSRT